MRESLVIAISIFLVIAVSGCARMEYYEHFSSRSPSNEREVRITRNLKGWAADYRFRIELTTKSGTVVLYDEPHESSIELVETYWSKDEQKLGMLVCNVLNSPVWVSYDLDALKPLSQDDVQLFLEQQIRRRYALSDSVNAIEWACSPAGSAAYRNLLGRSAPDGHGRN